MSKELPLTFASDADRSPIGSTRRDLARSAQRATHARVTWGVYADADDWTQADPVDRYRARALGCARRRRGAVISHQSAAALWGLPLLRANLALVHVTIGTHRTPHSSRDIRVHRSDLDPEDVVIIGGAPVTSLTRTLVDVAADADFATALVILDSAFHVPRFGRMPPLATVEQVWDAFDRSGPHRAHARSRRVLDFAVTSSESPLESVSRATMAQIGCPPPELQVEYRDRLGTIGRVDFDWPELGVIGEADGDGKYVDPALRGSRTGDEVLLAEKAREDRLRALGKRVTRWGWKLAFDPVGLARHLEAAGVPCTRRPRFVPEMGGSAVRAQGASAQKR